MEHLPALQVVVPLLGAPIAILLSRARLVWAWTWLVSVASAAMAWAQLLHVRAHGPVTYAMGGWDAPVGISYHIDLLAAWVLMLVTTVGALVMTWAPLSVDREIPRGLQRFFYAAYLLCLTGLLGMTSTGDAFNVFVFLEISSLASYVLVAMGKSRRALTAAYRYLIAGALGGTFILIGIGMMYQMTGTLNMADLALRLPAVHTTGTVLVSFAFITVGTSLKLALWPLHFWLPNAYTFAPSAISAFISATSTKVMVYVLMRFVFSVYGEDFAFDLLNLDLPLMLLALGGIYTASTVAIFQRHAKRLLAFSSVGQIGYMILAISMGTTAGVTAGILHLFHHALMKSGMFLALGNMQFRVGSLEIDDLRGIGRVMPWTTAAFAVGGLGLIGVPLTVGFTTKWALISALLADGLWPIAVLALASSLLAVAYVWRVVEAAWFHEPSEALAEVEEAPLALLVPTWIVIGATVVFGAWGGWTVRVATEAADQLLGGL